MSFKHSIGKERKTRGFTLIELSLSIVFITVLSLAVALIITNSISAYHRGLVLNQINTTGMELVDDMRAAIQNAQVVSIIRLCDTMYEGSAARACQNANGQSLVAVRKNGNVTIGKEEVRGIPLSGVFCTGDYSYIWNSGYYFSEDVDFKNNKPLNLKYKDEGGGEKDYRLESNQAIKLLKVKDDKRSVCDAYDSNSDTINILGDKYDVVTEVPVELLLPDSNLALYDLYAPAPAVGGGGNNMYYFVSFVLGTLQGGPNVKAQGNYCATPEGLDNSEIENFDYCAINKFNFAVQAVGGGE